MENNKNRMAENDFSFWFPKVKDCGIPTPRTFFTKTPSAETDPELARKFETVFYMLDYQENLRIIRQWLDKDVIPHLQEENLTGHIFLKNGRFSNKFDAGRSCVLYGTDTLAEAVASINYAALCLGAGGTDEIVVREFIEYARQETPCIYNGLPLRSEFRVFYDFDIKRPVFTANYWDWDTVFPQLYEATDRVVFEHERTRLERSFDEHKDEAQRIVSRAMSQVDGLSGPWSVDILLDETGKYWLIDMARAENSCYWNRRPMKGKQGAI